MKLVVTGTGRSGTGWAAAVLNSAGVFTGHENVFTAKAASGGLIDWCEYNADASWLAVPRLPLMNVRAALIIRNPLEVVASMLHIGFGHADHDNAHAKVASDHGGMTPDVDGYLKFWVNWNVAAFPKVDVVFTLDQLLAQPLTLTRWAGARYEPKPVGVVNDRPGWKCGDRPIVEWDHFSNSETVAAAQQIWQSLGVNV